MKIVSTPVNKIKLVPTKDFTLGSYPFEFFNYLQSLVYPYYNQDVNLVVSAATSAGKTVVAEQNIIHTITTGKKAIFLSPLKALTSQKYDDWTSSEHYLSKYKIEIITGDHKLTEAKITALKEADIILMTSELLDTRTRFINNANNAWIKDVGIIVVDEAHLLATSRGPALEVGLMRFTSINSSARVVLLSATMTNSSKIGLWVEQLNNKETIVIHTEWRPVDLHCHSIEGDTLDTTLFLLTQIADSASEKTMALRLLDDDPTTRLVATNRMQGGYKNTKTLVFTHTKNMGHRLVSLLEEHGFKAEFHNADLDKKARNKLEQDFKKDLDILVATSTLAWGLNLPARYVIVMGDQRGIDKVEPMDIAQMCGRAGRFGMYERGDVYLVDCKVSSQFEISSRLHDVLPFHIVAELTNKTFNNQAGALKWYQKSFSKVTSTYDAKILIDRCFDNLVTWGAIKEEAPRMYEVTPLGRIARDLYLDPEDIYNWRNNFNIVQQKDGWDNEPLLAWAVCDKIKMYNTSYPPSGLKNITQMLKMCKANKAIPYLEDKSIGMMSVVYYRLIREDSSKLGYDNIRALDAASNLHLLSLIKDIGRIFNALGRISNLQGWNKAADLETLKLRIIHGVGAHLVELISIPGIGGTIANQLYKAGLKTRAAVIRNQNDLGQYISRKANVTRILKGLKELQTQQEVEEL